jgi:hypothetical protein
VKYFLACSSSFAKSLLPILSSANCNAGLLRDKLGSARVARFFLGTKYQNGKNIPNYHKIFPVSIKYTKCHLIPNVTLYSNIKNVT